MENIETIDVLSLPKADKVLDGDTLLLIRPKETEHRSATVLRVLASVVRMRMTWRRPVDIRVLVTNGWRRYRR